MGLHRTCLSAAAILGLAMTAASIAAQDTPPGLADMVGARAGQGEGELQRRGYRFVRTETGDDRKWTFWYNATYGRCVTIATVDGRYDSILETPVEDCRGSGADERPPEPRYRGRPRRDYDEPRGGLRGVGKDELQQACKEEAADRFGHDVSRMYIMSSQKTRRGWTVYGYHQPRGTNEFYYCYFDLDGRLTGFDGDR